MAAAAASYIKAPCGVPLTLHDPSAQEDYADAARLLKQGDIPQARRRAAWDLMLACWLNEAQCWLKLEQWRRAVDICTDVLKHDAKSTKVIVTCLSHSSQV